MLTNFNLLEILECNTHTRNRKSLDDGNVKIVVLVVVTFLNVVVIIIEFFVNVAHFYNNSNEKKSVTNQNVLFIVVLAFNSIQSSHFCFDYGLYGNGTR